MAGTEFPWQAIACKNLPEEIAAELQQLVADLPNRDQAKAHDPQRRRQLARPAEQVITLTQVEYCVLHVLASRPYYAFSKTQIAQAVVRWLGESLAESQLDQNIWSLRDKLGIFHDCVQTVPQVGYRFKA